MLVTPPGGYAHERRGRSWRPLPEFISFFLLLMCSYFYYCVFPHCTRPSALPPKFLPDRLMGNLINRDYHL